MNPNDGMKWKRVAIATGIIAALAAIVAMMEQMPAVAAEPSRPAATPGITDPAPTIPHVEIRVPIGTTVSVQILSPVSLRYAKPGELVAAVTTEEIRFKGELVIPIGTEIAGRVIEHGRGPTVAFHRIGSYPAHLLLISPLANESAVLRFTDELIVR